jgi:uncharacterized repeat protein (TIGR03803 family)
MKTHHLLIGLWAAGFALLGPNTAPAQIVTTLYSFTGTGTDGGTPLASLTLNDGILYGTTAYGGSSGNGTVFSVPVTGGPATTLYSFTGGTDGSTPVANLLLNGSTLYGTTQVGGSSGDGTVFSMPATGGPATTLYSFTGGTDGASPSAGLVLSGNTLYGTAAGGGIDGNGTVFALDLLAAAPEPSTWALLFVGLAALAIRYRRLRVHAKA